MPANDACGCEPLLDPECVAYWFFRLNGCLTITNFVVHPDGRGGQRTDADILAVRFPHRSELRGAERLMVDHKDLQPPDGDRIVFVIAEVKTGRCRLNGPWTQPDAGNMQRVLHAIGMLPEELVPEAASRLYQSGSYSDDRQTIRLFAIGRERDDELLPAVTQLTWDELLSFIHSRFNHYRRQKSQHEQWDDTGKQLYEWALRLGEPEFAERVLRDFNIIPPHAGEPASDGRARQTVKPDRGSGGTRQSGAAQEADPTMSFDE